jgi:large subunit ribosomal protein L23
MTEAIKYPHVTEKAVDKMDFENKMVFICYPESNKEEIVTEVEDWFDVTTDGINTMIRPQGDKKAEVQLTDDHDAQEIASRIGVF